MSLARDKWRTASMKLNPSFGQLSDKKKKLNVLEAFKDPKDRLKDEVSDFFTETSFTALVRIYKATSFIKRLMWTLVVLFMVSWLVVQCYWLLDKYFKYPIEVKMDYTSANQLEFPSVTICNLNPILESKLDDSKYSSLEKYKTLETEDSLYHQTIDNWHFGDSCGPDDYQCSNGQCVIISWKCDGYQDCANNDDEANCQDWTCQSGDYQCDSGRCIPSSYFCDNYDDCPGGEDEPSTCDYSHLHNYYNGSGSTTYNPYSSGHGPILTGWTSNGLPTTSPSSSTPDAAATTTSTPDTPTTTTTSSSSSTPDTATLTTTSSSSSTPDTATSLSGAGRRKRRAAVDTEEMTKGGMDNFFRKLLAKFESENARMKNAPDTKVKYASFIKSHLHPLLKDRKNKMANIRRMEESLRPKLRSKRSAKSSRTVETLDWDTLLAQSGFNRWDTLGGNSSSSYYMERDDEYEATMTYAYITALMDEAEVEESGHAKNDFIASCKFGGYQCSPQNFTYFHNYKYGNCFTFNAIGHNVDLTTKFPGPSNGLILELFLDSDEYVANLSPGKGARVTVHKKGTAPFPEDEGFSVTNGLSINIGMRQVMMSRVPPPYGVCKEVGETEDYYMTHKDFHYSKLSCLKSCYQDIILEKCGCQTPLYFVREDLPVCNLTDILVDNCVKSLPVYIPTRYRQCDQMCPVPCSETQYEASFSMAAWPIKKAEESIKKKMTRSNAKYAAVDNIHEDFTRIQIYFVDLMYQYVEQQKAYESMNLISDLGGQLGLWLGLSAITLGELCSFLFSLGRSLPHTCCSSSQKKKVVEPCLSQPATLEDMYNEMKLKDLEDPPDVISPSNLLNQSKKKPG